MTPKELEDEEFEFRARAEEEERASSSRGEAEAATVGPGNMARLGQFVGRQMERFPAAIRGGVQAYQKNDANQAANLALQGFLNPESVQTTPAMMAGFGASTAPKIQVKTPPAGTQFNFKTRDFTPAKPETTYTTQAQEFANLVDLLMPTGAEVIGPLGKFVKGSGKVLESAALKGIEGAMKVPKNLKKLSFAPTPQGLFKPRFGFPEGVASKLGNQKTLENLVELHGNLGEMADRVLSNIPKINLNGAIVQAEKEVAKAIKEGGNRAQGISRKDTDALLNELAFWKDDAKKIGSRGWVTGQEMKNYRGSLMDAAKYDRPVKNNAESIIAATIHEKINKQLDNLSPEFRKLDRQFAETIPLRNAIAEATGREANKYPIGLRTGFMLAHPSTMASGLAKAAIVEGTSRMAPLVTAKRLGERVKPLGGMMERLPVYPFSGGVRRALMPEQNSRDSL